PSRFNQAGRLARPGPRVTPTLPPGRLKAAVALARWLLSRSPTEASWQLLTRLLTALKTPPWRLHSRARESPASRPKVASSDESPARQRAPARVPSAVGSSSR